MINNGNIKLIINFYNEKFKDWQPTVFHKYMPPFISGRDYFENVKNNVKEKNVLSGSYERIGL